MSLKNEEFVTVRGILGGLNTQQDSQDITDIQVADATNAIFDSFITPRGGSSLKWSKPVGETNAPLCLFSARTSNGLNYAIAVYAPNFYFRDETNNQWIKINQTYTPPVANISLMYSYVNWNAGRAADYIYACNGKDDFIKWPIAFSTLAVAAISTDTTLTLVDASYFSTSGGSLVVQELNGTAITATYTSKSGNVLTLSSPVGTGIGVGAGVVFQILDMPSMVKGKVITKNQRRLFVANYYGGETTVQYSNIDLPEDFTTGSGVTKGGALIISDGKGEITSMNDFGQYLVICKNDSIHRLDITLNSTLDAKLDSIFPLVTDVSMGPMAPWSVINKNHSIFFPTATEGIFTLAPVTTGLSVTLQVSVLSRIVEPTVRALDFSNARVATINQKIFWSCASQDVNDTVLVYDALRQYWTLFNNWEVTDWLYHKETLFFVSRIDGNIYQCFVGKTDYQGQETPYPVSVTTKRYDFGKPSQIKTMDLIHVQGYLSQTTTLNVDIMYNEGGKLQTLTRTIDGSDPLVVQPISEALAMVMLGIPVMGGSSITDQDSIGYMNYYIPVPNRYGFHNVQLRFYTNSQGADWGITGLGFNPQLEETIPPQLVKDEVDSTAIGSFDIIEEEDDDFLLINP